jgi:hypothetical protein
MYPMTTEAKRGTPVITTSNPVPRESPCAPLNTRLTTQKRMKKYTEMAGREIGMPPHKRCRKNEE